MHMYIHTCINRSIPASLRLLTNQLHSNQVNPALMGKLYHDIIIPLTKDVEVDYLMQRAE